MEPSSLRRNLAHDRDNDLTMAGRSAWESDTGAAGSLRRHEADQIPEASLRLTAEVPLPPKARRGR
jgi:hypothetical protein